MNNSIEMKDVTKTYPNFKMTEVSLEVKKGTIMGLVGENGAGKTTLLKLILNLINKENGSIRIFDKDNQKEEKLIKEDIGVVLDDSFFSEYFTPVQIGNIMKKFYRNWDQALFDSYLTTFQLPSRQKVKEFSRGMRMKLQIATALSHHPKLLLLDEPTSGLDPIVRSEILDIFMNFIQDEENSILLSTHITSDLEHIADYITFINQGQIIFSKSRDELLENYAIIKVSDQEFKKISPNDIIRFKKNRYDTEILIDNKRTFKKKYPSFNIEKANIEDIMILYIKGEIL